MIRVAVPGALGRMGQRVIEAVGQRKSEFSLVAAVERPGHDEIGRTVAFGVAISEDLAAAFAAADVAIDFTVPAATVANVQAATQANIAAVIGTTGLEEEQTSALQQASKTIPVLWAPNFSLGVNVMLELVEQATRALGNDFDLEVIELHHRAKRDAPSGTAFAIGQRMAEARGTALDDIANFVRHGETLRKGDELGLSTVRGGDGAGEHTAYFFGTGERLEITHRATDRTIFARGAVAAAKWLVGKPPGLYTMRDVVKAENRSR